MPDREVKLALATYIDLDGVSRWGMQGATVAVHPDHVERFDELNVDLGPPFVPERTPLEVVAPAGAESKSVEPVSEAVSIDPPEQMTVPELRGELDESEVSYPADALKPDLVKLVKKARKTG
jgi:hypothetical protein